MIRYKILALFLFLFIQIASFAQDITIQHLSTLNGLSQNDVNCIYQDSRGFMWFGTNDGLNRYDGYEFKVYREIPWDTTGIKSNLIYDISEDKTGNLWIGTSDNGLFKFDYKKERFINIYDLLPPYQKLKSDQIRTIRIDDNMTLWIGTAKGMDVAFLNEDGTYGLWFNQEKVQKNIDLFTKPINKFTLDDDGSVWVGAINSFCKLTQKDNDVDISKIPGSRGGVFSSYLIFGERVVITSTGLYQLVTDNVRKPKLKLLYEASFNEGALDNDNNLWCGNPSGIFKYKITKNGSDLQVDLLEEYANDVLERTSVYSIFHDRENNMWFGINGGGIYRFDVGHLRINHYSTGGEGSVSPDKIRSIYEDKDNNLWIGTEGSGINVLPAGKNRDYKNGFSHFQMNENAMDDHVYCIVGDDSLDFVLTGLNYPSKVALIQYKNNRLIKKMPDYIPEINSVFHAIVDFNGVLWLASYAGGVTRIVLDEDQKPKKITNFSTDSYGTSVLETDIIRSLCEDQYGNIWIGTGEGLYKLMASEKYKDSPEFVYYTNNPKDSSTISNNYILPIYSTNSGELWIGTMGGGLNRLIPGEGKDDDKFESLTMENGLPNNVIKGILEDDAGMLWVSTNRGISRIDPKTSKVRNFDIADGLQDYEFGELACCKRDDGELLFGGVNGFNAFYPSEIEEDTVAPKIVLTEFQILNQTIKPGVEFNGKVVLENSIGTTKNIKLKYSQNSFTFQFASLHYAAPFKNNYRYKLEGWDKDWISTEAENRIAKYTNIPSGKYIFKFEGSNSNGVWSKQPVEMEIEIVPPAWRNIYALIAYLIIVLASFSYWQRYSIMRARRRNHLNMERFEQNKLQELSKMKLRFYTNISHEFRTPLTLIIGPLQSLMKTEMGRDEQMKSLTVINRNANILLRLINQLMDFRAFEQDKMKLEASLGDVNQFISEIHNSFMELAKQKEIDFTFIAPSESINIWFDQDKFNKIMYNLLSNAFKFTPQKGKVSIQLINEQDNVLVKVIDNGYGMDEETQKHLFERFYQSSKIKNRKVGSTGIGLAFTKGLVEMHKGNISYYSQEGLGTTFTISLLKGDAHIERVQKIDGSNVRKEDFDNNQVAHVDDNEDAANAVLGDGKDKLKLLVVEDNDDLRAFVASQFSSTFQVYQASDGVEGIETILDKQPDMIVSDIMMPRKDGYTLLQEVKNDERMSHIPVILLTAKTSSEYKLKGYQKGADGYVEKPFDFELLQARVNAIIESRRKLRSFYQENIDVKPSDIAMTSADERFLTKIIGIVEVNISNFEFTVEQLTDEYGMTQNLFNKKLKSLTGQTSKAFIRTIRMKRAAQLFELGRYSVADVTYEVGFNDLKYFRQCFKTEFGLTPSEYIKKNAKKE